MYPLDYLVAAALLTAPPCSEAPCGSSERYAGLVPTIKSIGVAWEILDTREAHYLLMRKDDFRSDMNLLRERFHELLDAPPAADSMRFPPRPFVTELLAFNRTFRDHLEKCRVAGITADAHYEEMLEEVEHLYQMWDAIRDSRCDYYYITVRRQALKKARDMMGESAFYSGKFPPHVPVWRFHRID